MTVRLKENSSYVHMTESRYFPVKVRHFFFNFPYLKFNIKKSRGHQLTYLSQLKTKKEQQCFQLRDFNTYQ